MHDAIIDSIAPELYYLWCNVVNISQSRWRVSCAQNYYYRTIIQHCMDCVNKTIVQYGDPHYISMCYIKEIKNLNHGNKFSWTFLHLLFLVIISLFPQVLLFLLIFRFFPFIFYLV